MAHIVLLILPVIEQQSGDVMPVLSPLALNHCFLKDERMVCKARVVYFIQEEHILLLLKTTIWNWCKDSNYAQQLRRMYHRRSPILERVTSSGIEHEKARDFSFTARHQLHDICNFLFIRYHLEIIHFYLYLFINMIKFDLLPIRFNHLNEMQ